MNTDNVIEKPHSRVILLFLLFIFSVHDSLAYRNKGTIRYPCNILELVFWLPWSDMGYTEWNSPDRILPILGSIMVRIPDTILLIRKGEKKTEGLCQYSFMYIDFVFLFSSTKYPFPCIHWQEVRYKSRVPGKWTYSTYLPQLNVVFWIFLSLYWGNK